MSVSVRWCLLSILVAGTAAVARGEEPGSIRAKWEMPAQCKPFDPPRIKDLKEELRQTGYRLVIALHPAPAPGYKGDPPPRDLYIVNADGTGLRQLTNTPDREEHVPRTSPDGTKFTYNFGDWLVDVKTLQSKQINGGYVWTPDGKRTAQCVKGGIVYTDIETGRKSKPVPRAAQRELRRLVE